MNMVMHELYDILVMIMTVFNDVQHHEVEKLIINQRMPLRVNKRMYE